MCIRDRYDDSGSIKSWLYTIMRNLFLNCRRHSSRQEALPLDFEIPDTDDVQSGIEGEDSFSTTDVQRIMDLQRHHHSGQFLHEHFPRRHVGAFPVQEYPALHRLPDDH